MTDEPTEPRRLEEVMQKPDHKTDYSRIPDDVLANLVIETAMMDCEFHVGTPEGVELSDRGG